MSSVLSLENLKVGYSKPLFENLNLEINESEFVTIMGENGSGKSTLIKTILGLMKQEEGDIRFWGEVLDEKNHESVFQKLGVVLSGRESGLSPVGISDYLKELSKFYPSWDNKLMMKFFLEFDLDPSKKFYQLSLGEFSKVKLIRALSYRPKLLILDELTANLSARSKEVVLKHLIEEFSEHQMAVLYISHFKEEASRISDRVFDLSEKGLVEQ